MLKSIYIKDFTLINELNIELHKGLNIITGETGAGKSILIDAIDVAFGARAFKEQIKTGTSKSLIELQVKLPETFPLELLEENGIEPEEDNTLIISREILPKGTRSRINGVLVTQNYVQEIKKHLIDIHSQHETYTYIHPKTHIDLLDNYGDSRHGELLKKYQDLYRELISSKKEYELCKSNSQSLEQKVDFLKFQIKEIESAKIENTDEYSELIEERDILINAEELKELTYSSYSQLYEQENSIVDALNNLEKKLIKASEYDKNLSHIADVIAESAISLKDAATELRNYSENLDTDPQRLDEIEERIDLLDKLRRKYGTTLSEILDNLEKFKSELSSIEFSSDHLNNLEKKIAELEKLTLESAKQLSNSRQGLANHLSDLIMNELIKLEMPKVQFKINITEKNDITSKGLDEVEFLISANPGEPLKPLAKIASGGEISRVMLAIKTVFAKSDGVDTVIFDEIDAGISGKTSQAVAEKLSNLANSHQIICITHQPIIAAMADQHLYVEKVQNDNSTESKIVILNEEERIKTISKLASGSDDEESLNFAMKLLNQAQNTKLAGI